MNTRGILGESVLGAFRGTSLQGNICLIIFIDRVHTGKYELETTIGKWVRIRFIQTWATLIQAIVRH